MLGVSRWYLYGVAVAVLCGAASLYAQQKPDHRPQSQVTANAETSDPLDYTTNWIGNTFGGNDPSFPKDTLLHVPLDMDSIYVTPNGRVYSNVIWDERGRAISVFQNDRLSLDGHFAAWTKFWDALKEIRNRCASEHFHHQRRPGQNPGLRIGKIDSAGVRTRQVQKA